MANEADTCRRYITPAIVEAGWDEEPHSFTQEKSFTDGRILTSGRHSRRGDQKRADYLLRFTRDFPIAIVEAKSDDREADDGIQQAKEYAEILGLKFAYASNGKDIIEVDYYSGLEQRIDRFPCPSELWKRIQERENFQAEGEELILSSNNARVDQRARYYQDIAINKTIKAITKGQQTILLTMATGTGKTFTAFQICWRLWNQRWNRTGEYRRPKILYLSDRNILIDDPKDKMFASFGDARHKVGDAAEEPILSREMYFAIYQAIAEDSRRPGLYKEFPADFFDLIIVDECHRGSARDDSNWREILDYFEPAYKLGMTATPLHEENRNTYAYFGNPIYQYSLNQGIDDGFLAPYRVHRILSDFDVHGWRPDPGTLDRYGREIPEEDYQTRDFERVVALKARTEAIAHHLTDFMKKTDRFAKTIVFCVDQPHASAMRAALNNLNSDMVQKYPDYVTRVTSDEGDIGRGHLSNFQDPEKITPVILTTSKLLTTGVDIPTCKNIVIARVVNSMTEFKQIIGRGTRINEDYGKLVFDILDYTGSATRKFADPEFDGFPALLTQAEIDEFGNLIEGSEEVLQEDIDQIFDDEPLDPSLHPEQEDYAEPNKYYYDEGYVEIHSHIVYDLDPDGNRLSVIKLTDYAAREVRTLYPNAVDLKKWWVDPRKRGEIVNELQRRGLDFEELAKAANQPDSDPFDLLCYLAYSAPLRSRNERADRVRREEREFFENFSPQAKEILQELLDKYAQHGTAQFTLPDILKVPPISDLGNVIEISKHFGGAVELREAVHQLQNLIYEEQLESSRPE